MFHEALTSEQQKDIWFIVGEDHLDGLHDLFENHSSIDVKIHKRDTKNELFSSSENTPQPMYHALSSPCITPQFSLERSQEKLEKKGVVSVYIVQGFKSI